MSSALHSRFFSNILYSLNLLTLKSATMQEAMDPRPFCVESFPCSSNHVQKPTTVVACSVVKRGRRRRRRIFLPGVVNVEASNNNCLQASLSQEVARRSVIAGVGVDEATAATPVAIQVQNLGLSLSSDKGEIPVLKDCSLRIPEGQLWMLLGPNGCGKSTILKAMAGLLQPNQGHMYVAGPRSFVFQNPDHQVVMPTVEVDVAFGLGRFNLPLDEVWTRVHNALEAVGMDEYAQRPIQTLSGGQKQRVAIAGALAEASRVLLLDELTTFLDETDQMGVLNAVRKVVGGADPVTALWVTHRLEELDYADGAIYMENGRVVLSGTVEDVKWYIQKQQDQMHNNGGFR